jgi:hypothetical protein
MASSRPSVLRGSAPELVWAVRPPLREIVSRCPRVDPLGELEVGLVTVRSKPTVTVAALGPAVIVQTIP